MSLKNRKNRKEIERNKEIVLEFDGRGPQGGP